MPASSSGARDSSRVLHDLIDAFAEPGAAHPALAAQVVALSRELLEGEVVDLRPRMPTLLFPRSAVFDVPDGPPVPPAAL